MRQNTISKGEFDFFWEGALLSTYPTFYTWRRPAWIPPRWSIELRIALLGFSFLFCLFCLVFIYIVVILFIVCYLLR